MAALLISSFFPTNGVADCYSGNHQGKNHHELREHLKVTHDSVPLSPLLRGVRGRRKAKRHLLSFKPWSLFTGSVIIISCQTMPVKPSEQLFNLFGLTAGNGGSSLPRAALFQTTRPPRAVRTPLSARNRNIVAKFVKIRVAKRRRVWYIYG